MTDRKNFEAMLEALINEDQQAARDIFHNIVVAKSRQIYETLLAEDFDLYEKEDEDEDAEELDVDDTDSEEDEDPELGDMDLGDEEDEEPEMGDMDIEDEDGDEGDLEDRVLDLEDALEDLKAEFEELMADNEGEDEFSDEDEELGMGDMDLGDEEDEEPGMGDMDLGDEENDFGGAPAGGMGRGKPVYEYVNKVPSPKHGDNGVNSRSPVAKPNRMGGTSANIVKGGEANGGGTNGGLLNPSTKEENFGNMNKPGANVGKTAFKKRVAAPSAGKAAADRGASSPISGLKSRSK